MNNYQRCAAKDYLREACCLIEDLDFALSPRKNTDCISLDYINQVRAVLSTLSGLSRSLMEYSENARVKSFAENIKNFGDMYGRELGLAKRYCKGSSKNPEKYLKYTESFRRIHERLIDDLNMCEISERINTDYLRHTKALLTGLVRMSENAMGYELCRAIGQSSAHLVSAGREAALETESYLSGKC
ncbi:MAG: hypothetical protein U0M06_08065 [Clostridia bacterium]|nr:hypothetical protein [Clostridia bacterium]